MPGKNVSEHQNIIRQLFDADRNARQNVENARREAESTIEAARNRAEEMVNRARKEAQSEADALVEASEAEQATGASDESPDIQVLRRHARDNMNRAVDFLVDWVTAKTE